MDIALLIIIVVGALLLYYFGLVFTGSAGLYPRRRTQYGGIEYHPLHAVEGFLWPIVWPIVVLVIVLRMLGWVLDQIATVAALAGDSLGKRLPAEAEKEEQPTTYADCIKVDAPSPR